MDSWSCLVVAMHCYHMRQVYGFLELSCGGNALLPHEASLWILGVALWWQCIATMRQVYGFLELPMWWQCIVTMRQVYGFLELLWWQCMLQ